MIRVLYAKKMLNAMIGARLVFYRAYLAIWNVLTIWHGTLAWDEIYLFCISSARYFDCVMEKCGREQG